MPNVHQKCVVLCVCIHTTLHRLAMSEHRNKLGLWAIIMIEILIIIIIFWSIAGLLSREEKTKNEEEKYIYLIYRWD